MKEIKVLAVADPAVFIYVDETKKIIETYKSQQQDTTVTFDIIPWSDYYGKMITVLEGDSSYDIVMVAGHLWLADFVDKEYLAEIPFEDNDVLEVIKDEMSVNSKTYLSPSFCDGHMIVYRKSMLEKNINSQIPAVISPSHYIKLVKQVYQNTKKPVIALKADISEILLDMIPFIREDAKSDVYQSTETFINLNVEAITSGLEKYSQLKEYALPRCENFGNVEVKNAFVDEEVPMIVTWSGQLGEVYQECEFKDDLGFSTFSTAWNVTWSFAIPCTTQNYEEALHLLTYLRSEEVDQMVGEYCGAPVRKSSYLEGKEKLSWYENQLEMIEHTAKPLPHVLKSGEINGVLYQELHNFYTEKKSLNQTIFSIEEQLNTLRGEK